MFEGLEHRIGVILEALPDELTRAEINEFVMQELGPEVMQAMAYEGLSSTVASVIRQRNSRCLKNGEVEFVLAAVTVEFQGEDGELQQKEVRRLASVLTPKQRAQHCMTFHKTERQAVRRKRQICEYHARIIGGAPLQAMLPFGLDPDLVDLPALRRKGDPARANTVRP